MKIGELARKIGLTIRTLRYYEELGLIKPPNRSKCGFRLFSEEHISRIEGKTLMTADYWGWPSSFLIENERHRPTSRVQPSISITAQDSFRRRTGQLAFEMEISPDTIRPWSVAIDIVFGLALVIATAIGSESLIRRRARK